MAPVVRGRKGNYETLMSDLAGQGYARAMVDGEAVDLAGDLPELERYEMHDIKVVVDRLVRRDGIERRLTDSMETALGLAEGVAEIEIVPAKGDTETEPSILTFSQHLSRPSDGKSFEELAPRNFSFNSPYGACSACDGLGTTYEVDPELVVPNPGLSINDGAIHPWSGNRSRYFGRLVEAVCDEYGIPADLPWSELSLEAAAVSCSRVGRRRRSPFSTRTGTAGSAPTTPPSRVLSPICGGATPSPSPTASASRSRATCARSTALRVVALG